MHMLRIVVISLGVIFPAIIGLSFDPPYPLLHLPVRNKGRQEPLLHQHPQIICHKDRTPNSDNL